MPRIRIGVALKPASRRTDIDPLTGAVTADHHPPTLSPADRAALETAVHLAESWDAPQITAATASGPDADPALREALAMGATRAVRVHSAARTESSAAPIPGTPESVRTTASALAQALADCAIVVCGDTSPDGGTGAVPALLAAELGRAQCLGLISLVAGKPGEIIAERRLDAGRRERVRVRAPMVISVEPGAARPRRAALPAVLAAGAAKIEVSEAPHPHAAPAQTPVRTLPYRPRPRALPGPDPALPPLSRVDHITGTLADREPPRRVDADPPEAARAIADQLRAWGYL